MSHLLPAARSHKAYRGASAAAPNALLETTDSRQRYRKSPVARADLRGRSLATVAALVIENLLGLDMHSVDRVLPEFQQPEIGDTIGLGSNRMRIERVEPRHVLAWRSEDGNWVWTFVLEETGGTTRLISRNRFRLATVAARIGMLPMEPGSLIIERKMLHGIKERAERLSREADVQSPY